MIPNGPFINSAEGTFIFSFYHLRQNAVKYIVKDSWIGVPLSLSVAKETGNSESNHEEWLLGVSQSDEKAPIGFVMSVCLSVRMCPLGSHWTDFREIWYFKLLLRSAFKFPNLVKSRQNIGHFTWRLTFILLKYFFGLKNSIKGKHCCFSVAAFRYCIMLTAT